METAGTRVDSPTWRSTHTFAASDFDVQALLEAKGTRRVSVVIPARNEAPTIGPIIASIRQAHIEGSGLVDELIVIDSDSTDGTAAVARSAGATVHSAADIRPDLRWQPGKGEAMWKSLFVTEGEFIVFIDADLTTFSPAYVTGLLGPLLLDGEVAHVKAFYDRDLAGADHGQGQGGRVTELVARPLLNLWWPELAEVVQPLAGEWSARRTLLEQLALPCGYGVELAVLVDTYERFGLGAIAQVDLGQRQHIHQDLASLGLVAAEVLAAATRRRFAEDEPAQPHLVQPTRVREGDALEWRVNAINTHERPAQGDGSTRP